MNYTKTFLILAFGYFTCLLSLNTFSQNSVIVLDPGHGFASGPSCPDNNCGTISYQGNTVWDPDYRSITEIETALAVAQKLKVLLDNSCPNVTTYLTRTTNVIDMNIPSSDPCITNTAANPPWLNASDRAFYANCVGADLFLSIHCNACTGCNPPGNGTETFYCDTYRSGGIDQPNPYLNDDILFANDIQDNMVLHGHWNYRQVIEFHDYMSTWSLSPFHLGALRYNSTQGKCLNEIGFVDNPSNAVKLLDDAWRDSFALAYFTTIQTYLNLSCGTINPCGTPTNLSESNTQQISVSLDWDDISGAQDYELQYRETGGNWSNTINTGGSSVSLNNLTCGKTYEWRVRTECSGSTFSGRPPQGLPTRPPRHGRSLV